MNIFYTVKQWHDFYKNLNNTSQSIGFVPTMGSLHDGHLSLCKNSLKENDFSIVSIFVNPTQFNDKKDFDNYPIDIKKDIKLLDNIGINNIFIPEYKEIYKDNFDFQIHENNYSTIMEGAYRSGHFTGVLTVVMKLLNIIKPNNIYMGEKDYQQAYLIKNMINAFFMDINIKICPTIRDTDGLALSSRNKLLSNHDLLLSKQFNKILKSQNNINIIKQKLIDLGFVVEYIEEYNNRRFGAVKIGDVRLIDNVVI